MPGPKPKPTALKKLAGNPGKRKLNDAEPQLSLNIPSCPAHLSPAARREWRRIAPELFAVGLLTNADRAALAAYCQAWANWVEAERDLRDEGKTLETATGYVYQNPLVGIANKALDQVLKAAAEFGMTPAARSKVKAEKPVEDPFEDFVNRKFEE